MLLLLPLLITVYFRVEERLQNREKWVNKVEGGDRGPLVMLSLSVVMAVSLL